MTTSKIGLPVLLVGGAAAAFLLSRKGEASEGGDTWDGYDDSDYGGDAGTPPRGGQPIDLSWWTEGAFDPPTLNYGVLGAIPGYLDSLSGNNRVNEILDALSTRAEGMGLTLDDVRTVVDQLGLRSFPANLARVIRSMENMDELMPLLASVAAPITPPSSARSVPALSTESEVLQVQQALNRIEALMVEAAMVQWSLWRGSEVPGYEGLELSSQFGSSVFTTYVHQLQQLEALGLRPATHVFLAALDGRVCGQRGAFMRERGIEWRASGGQLHVGHNNPPSVPVAPQGWSRTQRAREEGTGFNYAYTQDAAARTLADWTWPVAVDGIQGPCTDYAQSVIFAAATYVGLADVAAGITGMDPRTGNQNPSYFDPMGVVRSIERNPALAHHLVMGYRAMVQAGLIEWQLHSTLP